VKRAGVAAARAESIKATPGISLKTTFIILTLVIITLAGFSFMEQESGRRTITVQETHTLMQSDTSVLFLDVRTPQEWSGSSGRLEGAILIPLQDLEERMHELDPHKEKTIIAYCRSGNRSGTAARMLAAKGFKAANMLGGMIRWNADLLPVARETGQ
jgi:rhodanese-related sulfurtransferase